MRFFDFKAQIFEINCFVQSKINIITNNNKRDTGIGGAIGFTARERTSVVAANIYGRIRIIKSCCYELLYHYLCNNNLSVTTIYSIIETRARV